MLYQKTLTIMLLALMLTPVHATKKNKSSAEFLDHLSPAHLRNMYKRKNKKILEFAKKQLSRKDYISHIDRTLDLYLRDHQDTFAPGALSHIVTGDFTLDSGKKTKLSGGCHTFTGLLYGAKKTGVSIENFFFKPQKNGVLVAYVPDTFIAKPALRKAHIKNADNRKIGRKTLFPKNITLSQLEAIGKKVVSSKNYVKPHHYSATINGIKVHAYVNEKHKITTMYPES